MKLTEKELAARGITIERIVMGYAYPRNGNAHKTTPRVTWVVKRDGQVSGSYCRKRDALGLARDLATV